MVQGQDRGSTRMRSWVAAGGPGPGRRRREPKGTPLSVPKCQQGCLGVDLSFYIVFKKYFMSVWITPFTRAQNGPTQFLIYKEIFNRPGTQGLHLCWFSQKCAVFPPVHSAALPRVPAWGGPMGLQGRSTHLLSVFGAARPPSDVANTLIFPRVQGRGEFGKP